MATQAIIVFGRAGGRSTEGSSLPVLRLDSEATEVLAVTGTSKKTTGAASTDGGFVAITARGGDVFVATGADPTALLPTEGTPGRGHPVLSGQCQAFAIGPGAKVAVIALPAA